MQNATINNAKAPAVNLEPLKVTALLYLQEALENELYEDCAELIASAKEFGAQQNEISRVLGQFVGGFKGRGYEVNRNGRRRF